MAKKRKRKRRPAPPPRPGTTIEELSGVGHREVQARPAAAAPQPQPSTDERRTAAVKRRDAAKRRKRLRYVAIGVAVLVAIAGVVVFRQVQNRQRVSAHERIASAAGCDPVRTVGDLGRDHWVPGQSLPTYETSPPAGGDHAGTTAPANFYTEPFSDDINATPSIYQAVHSLEHGYVIVWTNELTVDERNALEGELRPDARKVIVAPYPGLGERKMALSAWGRLQFCDEAGPEVVSSFVDLFREKTAPENQQP